VNQGNAQFKDEAKAYGLTMYGYSQHAVFFDMDNDNDLDAYISPVPILLFGLVTNGKGKRNPPDKCRNKLYRNDNGKYTEIGKKGRIGNTYGYALSVVNADLNKDGYQDIFVSNDYADNDYMFINQKNGTLKTK
jgi:hypothetical protein